MVIIPDVSPLLLNLPIFVSIIAIFRYVVGLKTWRNYTALAIALSLFTFLDKTTTGLLSLLIWVIMGVFLFVGALASRYLIRRFHLHYYARIALVYIGGIVGVIVFIALLSLLKMTWIISGTQSALGIVLLCSTIDDLATLAFKKDSQEFIRRFMTTLLLGGIGGLIFLLPIWNHFIAGHQEVLLIVLLADIITATWSQLRLTEFLRFSSLSKKS